MTFSGALCRGSLSGLPAFLWPHLTRCGDKNEMTKTERAALKRIEQLKDRRDYRATLIQRRNDIDAKIEAVEQAIRDLSSSERGTAK